MLAKFLELRGSEAYAGKRCLELGAGCGLLSCVLARMGAATVVATDMACNLPLLRENLEANCDAARVSAHAHALTWGRAAAEAVLAAAVLGDACDLLVASDIMYVVDAVPDLVATLQARALRVCSHVHAPHVTRRRRCAVQPRRCSSRTAATAPLRSLSLRLLSAPVLLWRRYLLMHSTRRTSAWTSRC